MSFKFMAADTIFSDFGAKISPKVSQKTKYLTVSIVSTSICNEVIGPDAMIFSEC